MSNAFVTPHTASLFPLILQLDTPIVLTRYQVSDVRGAQVSTARLGNVGFQFGKQYETLAKPHRGELLVTGLFDVEVDFKIGDREFHLTPIGSIETSLRDPSYRDVLRRFIADGIKHYLVYDAKHVWFRQGAYFRHKVEEQRGGGICRGMELDVVIFEDGSVAVALDERLVPLGAPLATLPAWLDYVQNDPYARRSSPTDEETEEEGDEERARNYVLLDDGKLKKVYIDIAETRKVAADNRVVVRRMRSRLEGAFSVTPERLRPVLASGEVEQVLGGRWNERARIPPDERMNSACDFVEKLLSEIPLFGSLAEVVPEPMDLSSRIGVLSWPSLSMGDRGPTTEGIAFHSSPDPNHRQNALKMWGPRVLPTLKPRLVVVPLEGELEEAQGFANECGSLFNDWKMDRGAVELSKVALMAPTQNPDIMENEERARVEPIVESLLKAEKPTMMLVFKENRFRKGDAPEPVYSAIHQRLGDDLGIPVKPLQGLLGKKSKNLAVLTLSGLIARAGGVPWGLSPLDGEAYALRHDLVFGVDIGGRSRTSGSREEFLAILAMAGDDRPRIIHRSEPISGESIMSERLESIILGMAEELSGSYQRGWLYLRDGNISKTELKALHTIAREAEKRGLLGPGQTFTAVEVRKDHPFRLFSQGRNSVDQPHSGAILWLSEHDAILATTGRPWNLPTNSTAMPIRCVFHTLAGQPCNQEGAQDIWRLTHLAWKMPAKECSLPMPLHIAHDLAEDRSQGKSMKGGLPF